jgi:hypothetical protein
MSKKESFLKKAEKFIGQVMEFVIMVIDSVLAYFNRKVNKVRLANIKLKQELEEKKNEEKVKAANSGKSDADVVRDAISEGKSIRQPEVKKGFFTRIFDSIRRRFKKS